MMTDTKVYSDLPIPPGEYLEEVIAELGMTKDELARRMNRPAAKLSAIFAGDKAITPDTALQLEKVVAVPAHIWTGLEADYRLSLARQQKKDEEQSLEKESALVTRFRYAELAKRGLVEKKTKAREKVLELHRFFGVTSLRNLPGLKRYQAAFRSGKGKKRKRSPEALVAWLRIGELEAQKTVCPPFDYARLENSLAKIRTFTLRSPEHFESALRKILSDSGVVFVLAPHLSETYAHGATFWVGPHKAVLMLTLRGSWADIFWFSLFHELGHILLHLSKHEVILESDEITTGKNAIEREADQFATEALIPSESYRKFVTSGSFHDGDLRRFANQIGVDAGIVVGRLQHDGLIQNSWHNKLRSRYEWKAQK